MDNYNKTISLNTTADKVFGALTDRIPLWWTEMFEGSANKEGDNFTIRFGNNIFKTMNVKELSGEAGVVWSVTDSLIAIPGLNNQKEWIGTTILWKISPKKNHTELQLTHIGLNPDIECYEICADGWQQFINSLQLYLETGTGNPYKK